MVSRQLISKIAIFFCAVVGSSLAHGDAQAEDESAFLQGKVETIVCIRHGEKPLLDLAS